MSTYYDISLSYYKYNELLDVIETAVKHANGFDKVYELIHLYDYLESEMERSIAKYNTETRRYLEQQQLFNEDNIDNIFHFNKIKEILEKYDLKLDIEEEFYLICELSNIIKEEDVK